MEEQKKEVAANNLVSCLQDEMNRVREIIQVYEDLPNNAGCFSAVLMNHAIRVAERAIANGDVIKMLNCVLKLKDYIL